MNKMKNKKNVREMKAKEALQHMQQGPKKGNSINL